MIGVYGKCGKPDVSGWYLLSQMFTGKINFTCACLEIQRVHQLVRHRFRDAG
jgi:hypothetical protein